MPPKEPRSHCYLVGLTPENARGRNTWKAERAAWVSHRKQWPTPKYSLSFAKGIGGQKQSLYTGLSTSGQGAVIYEEKGKGFIRIKFLSLHGITSAPSATGVEKTNPAGGDTPRAQGTAVIKKMSKSSPKRCNSFLQNQFWKLSSMVPFHLLPHRKKNELKTLRKQD